VARTKTLDRLRELLERYDFTGVFLDKIRYPSPANGLEEAASCFCEYCYAKAGKRGLNLDEVAVHLGSGAVPIDGTKTVGASDWLALITRTDPPRRR
jgi:hypothetical protein